MVIDHLPAVLILLGLTSLIFHILYAAYLLTWNYNATVAISFLLIGFGIVFENYNHVIRELKLRERV